MKKNFEKIDMDSIPTLREFYHKVGLDDEAIFHLNRELKIHSFTNLTHEVHETRIRSLHQAKSDLWSHGPELTSDEISADLELNYDNMSGWARHITPIYKIEEFVIGAARPGKEAATDYAKIKHYHHCSCDQCKSGNRVQGVNNPHDMFPYISKNNILLSAKRRELASGRTKVTPWTFEHIFSLLEEVNTTEQTAFALEILGSIMVRLAFMLDHKFDKEENLFLSLPTFATSEMSKRIPFIGKEGFEIPTASLIYFLDILGYNEDVKVDVCGYRNLRREYSGGPRPQDNGRTNTLLTISHMLAAVLHRRPIGEFAYGLFRGLGMNPMSKGTIHPAFPLLSANLELILDEKITLLHWSP